VGVFKVVVVFFFFFFPLGTFPFILLVLAVVWFPTIVLPLLFFSPSIQLIAGVLCNLSLLVMLCVSYVCCFVNWHVSISSASPCWFGLALGISILIMIKHGLEKLIEIYKN